MRMVRPLAKHPVEHAPSTPGRQPTQPKGESVSKNDRVLNFPTVDRLAQIIADHYDADLGLADVEPPNQADIELARKIHNEIATAAYLGYVGNDIHGYSLFFRRLIGWAIIGVLALILILTLWSAS